MVESPASVSAQPAQPILPLLGLYTGLLHVW